MPQLFAILLLCAIGLFGNSALSADEETKPSISVTGTAVTRATPDTIVWSITTTDEDRDLTVAKKASDEAAKRVMALGDTLDLESGQLTSGRLAIEKIYNRDQHRNKTTFKHFRVQRHYTLKQKDLTKFDEFLTQIVGGPVEASFFFESSKIYDLRDETRIKAIKLARKKAEAMADALGVEVGKPITISEAGGGGAPRVTMFNGMSSAPAAGPIDGASGAIVPDAIEVVISVNVTFELK